MKTPFGIDLEVGQRWQECDNRFVRIVKVTGWDEDTGKVELDARTWAKLSRFSGKSGGYKPVTR